MTRCPRCRAPLPDTDALEATVHMASHLDAEELDRLRRWARRLSKRLGMLHAAARPTNAPVLHDPSRRSPSANPRGTDVGPAGDR